MPPNKTLNHKPQVRLPAKVSRELRQQETNAEQLLWSRLRNRQLGGWKFRRQQRLAHTVYVADFFCYAANLIIELDGPIHQQQEKADALRQQDIESLGNHVLRFTNAQVFDCLDCILIAIRQALENAPNYSLPATRGEERRRIDVVK